MDELGEESAGFEDGDLASDLTAEEAEPIESATEAEPDSDDLADEIEEIEEAEKPEESEDAEEPEEVEQIEETEEPVDTRTENQIKGEDFEGKTIDEMSKIEGMELIYGGGKSHSYDACFYHPDIGIIVTDSKDYGSEDKPGYVQEVSAFTPERAGSNMTKMLAAMDADAKISPETKDAVWQALEENRAAWLVVGSDTTRMSENKQAELGRFTNISDLKSTIDALRKN